MTINFCDVDQQRILFTMILLLFMHIPLLYVTMKIRNHYLYRTYKYWISTPRMHWL